MFTIRKCVISGLVMGGLGVAGYYGYRWYINYRTATDIKTLNAKTIEFGNNFESSLTASDLQCSDSLEVGFCSSGAGHVEDIRGINAICDSSQDASDSEGTATPSLVQHPSNEVSSSLSHVDNISGHIAICDSSQDASDSEGTATPSLVQNPSNEVHRSLSHVDDSGHIAICDSSQKAHDPESLEAPPLVKNPYSQATSLICTPDIDYACVGDLFVQNSQLTVREVDVNSVVASRHNVQAVTQSVEVDWISILESQHPSKMYDPAEDYDTIREIGVGSFGKVYLAKHRQIQEEFAIKKIPFGGHGNQENIVMELEILRYSCHKNILFLTESYVYNSNVYIVTEYIDGLPLSRLCKIENLCLTEVTIASITKECLQGLEYLHERSCVHCDIKGSNILLSRDGKVKLADFGLAFKTNDNIYAGCRGTFFWRAPEISNKVPYGSKVDVWSLGIVVMEMLQGHPPLYWVEDVNEMMSLSKTGYSTMSEEVEAMVSNDLKDFLHQGALIVNPEDRLSAHDLLNHPFMLYGDNCECLPWIVAQAMQQQMLS